MVDETIPVIVLIDRGSASASEILAGALKDTDRAYLIGETTFGKGSVQQIRSFGNGGFKLTTSRYYTPAGKNIDGIGIEPHLTITEEEFTDEELDYLPEVFYSYYENLSDSIVYNQFGIISFQVRQVNNKGGRMSYETVRNYVLDLSSGELMVEGDIFSAGYDLALRPLLQGSLLEAHGVKSVQELEDLGFFGIDEIVPNKNFLINDKGITYTFNKGEYSAYQLQVPEVFIPYTAVRSLLRENSVVSKLARLK